MYRSISSKNIFDPDLNKNRDMIENNNGDDNNSDYSI